MPNSEIMKVYKEILETELVEATGCTEPIALALCGAKARQVLGVMPDRVDVYCSGNIIKNVKGVVVPNSGGVKGMDTAVLLGMVAGDPEANLQVISKVDDEQRKQLIKEKERVDLTCHLAQNVPTLYIRIEASKDDDHVLVEIQETHSNFTRIIRNDEIILNNECKGDLHSGPDKSLLNVKDIYDYANSVDINDVEEVISRQIKDNIAISAEGLKNSWGESVGKLISEYNTDDNTRLRARAAAAAGSDARMNGCPMPVVINSGSGNQGMTVSLPVIEYGKTLNVSREKLIRALVLANLVALHQKRYIGYLSAYCGATSAAAGAGCGVAYLNDMSYKQICMVITNTIATIGGMVCDGAKSSCAGKISLAVEAALLGVNMAKKNNVYRYGEGMVKDDIEKTIIAYGRMAAEGMKSTDVEILNIMLED